MTMTEDTNTIIAIENDVEAYVVGVDDVAEITAYNEQGVDFKVPYLRVVRGRATFKRLYAIGYNLQYARVAAPEPDPHTR